MKNIIDTTARYLATILISALSVMADADDLMDSEKKYTARINNSVNAGISHKVSASATLPESENFKPWPEK